MNIMKSFSITLLLLLLNQTISGQQFKSTSFITQEKLDSVVIFKVFYKSKEFITPSTPIIKPSVRDSITGAITLPYYDDAQEKKDTVIILSRKKITKTENISLNQLLKKQSSFSKKGVALLSHYDIEINYYKQEKIIQNVKVSTMTKKISIKRETCHNNIINTPNNCLFYGSASRKLEVFILKLIPK